jgi:hypothetical protein
MRESSSALEKSKATAATQLTNEECSLAWIPPDRVVENRVAHLILNAMIVLTGLLEKALKDFPRNVCNPYVPH